MSYGKNDTRYLLYKTCENPSGMYLLQQVKLSHTKSLKPKHYGQP